MWLARKLIVDLGPQEALDFMRASNEQAAAVHRLNAAKTTDEALVKAFDKLDEGLDPVSVDAWTLPAATACSTRARCCFPR